MQLADIMSRDVDVIAPTTTLAEAATMMRDRDYGLLPIGENDRLIGTITDRDMVVRGVSEGRDSKACTVREVMSGGIHYCYEDQDVSEAARLMHDKQVRRLPVLNRDKRLVGMIALADLATHADSIAAGAKALSGISEE